LFCVWVRWRLSERFGLVDSFIGLFGAYFGVVYAIGRDSGLRTSTFSDLIWLYHYVPLVLADFQFCRLLFLMPRWALIERDLAVWNFLLN